MERLGPSLEVLWSVLGVSLKDLGASWKRPGGILGASWGYLGRFLGVLPISKRSEAVLKASWERLGGAWGRLGCVWERPGRRFGASLGCLFVVFETSLKRIGGKPDF